MAEMQGQVKDYLDAWKRSLLDLSRRNRLLYFNLGMATRIQLADPAPQSLYHDLVGEERTLEFPYARGATLDDLETVKERSSGALYIAPGDIRTLPPVQGLKELRDLYRRLERLRRGTQTIWEEQGVHTLFVALGMLEWLEAEQATETIRSPLLLLSVTLEQSQDRFCLRAYEDDLELNPALAYRLQRDFGVSLPEMETEESGADTVIDEYLSRVEAAMSRRGWRVAREAWLAQFAFHKLPMYRDLEGEVVIKRAATHPIVAALCGVQEAQRDSQVDVREVEDAYARPESFPVLDVDSSQLEVLERVRRGETLVVQGPPGTGKSQTIVNLIAQSLRDGKKVLFVSEKRAALEVVYRRLEALGLAGVCLDLHSHRASRKAVVEELVSTLEAIPGWRHRPNEAAFEEYRQLKTRLDEYVRELHRPRDRKGRTVYEVHGRLAGLQEVPLIVCAFPFQPVLEADPGKEAEVADLVNRLSATGIWDEEDTHPWREVVATPEVAVFPEVVARACSVLEDICARLVGISREIGRLAGIEAFTAQELEMVMQVLESLTRCPSPPLPAPWLELGSADLPPLVEFARETRAHVEQREQQEALLRDLEVEPANAAGEAVVVLYHFWAQAKHAWVWRRLQTKRQIQRELRKLTGRKFSRRVAISALLAWYELYQARRWLAANETRLSEDLGLGTEASTSDLEAVLNKLDWLGELLAKTGGKLPPGLREVLLSETGEEIRRRATALLQDLGPALDEFQKACKDECLASLFPESPEGQPLKQIPVELLEKKAGVWQREAGRLPQWLNYRRLLQEAERLGLKEFLQACRAHRVSAAQLGDTLWRAYFTRWLQEVYTRAPSLTSFEPEGHERLRRRFSELDRDLQREAVKAVLFSVASSVPQPLPLSEESRLRREAAKKRRHLPLRRLFPQIPNLLLALKPCLMMSPLSIATHLPQEVFAFDLVIIDEASQLPPGDAIGALLRAKQAVIFGDKWQLPPTDFFQAHVETVEEAEDALDYESILDIAGACFPGPMLRWHYRSRDERLIAFSSRRFYEGKLITFPAPSTNDTETGVSFVYVPEGVYGRGGSRTNVAEARRIASLIVEHFRTQPHRSLGVIAMSIEQRDAIEEALRRLRREHPEIVIPENEVEPFFVKNLETVQGDERDVIIFGVGYGPSTPGGPPTLQFGPLSRQGGERRLNVAITRARYRLVVVASMQPDRLGQLQTRWEGPRLLMEYLAYAQSGGVERASETVGEPESEFEAAVRDALTARGYQVDCQVGVSSYRIDLGIRDPENPTRYLVGVECDGAMYHSSRTARDRDRIRQEILEGLGWKILRVWSTDWIRDPNRATERLIEAIERVRQARYHPRKEPDRLLSDSPNSRAPEEGSETLPGTEEAHLVPDGLATAEEETFSGVPTVTSIHLPAYRAFHASTCGRRLQEEGPETLAKAIRQVVDEEGPIHIEQAFYRVLNLYGGQRLGKRVKEALSEGLGTALRKRWLVRRGAFLWSQKQTSVVARGPGDVHRPPEHIAPEEWAAAVLEGIRQLGATPKDNLLHSVAEAMGYGRLSAELRSKMEAAVASLAAEGKIVEWEGLLYLGAAGFGKTAPGPAQPGRTRGRKPSGYAP